MTLKQVVLPAPLGPIRPRISPVLMWNETPSRALTPPKRRVTSSTSSILPGGSSAISSTRMSTEVSGTDSTASSLGGPSLRSAAGVDSDIDRSFLDDLGLLGGTGSHGPPRRQQALRAEDGQCHQGDAEEQEPAVGQEPELLGGPGEQGRRHDHAPAVALDSDDDHRHEEDRVDDGEVVRVDERLLAREQRPGQAADRRSGREGQQLEPER